MNAELSPSRLTFPLSDDEIMRPVPEVVLLLDTDGRILRASERHAGPRLSGLEFIAGKKPHRVLHERCRDKRCPLTARWNHAWAEHRAGLPIEWISNLQEPEGVFKIRLQAVSYACGVLFDGSVSDYGDCSVAFIQDVTEYYTPRGEARMRRSTDLVFDKCLGEACKFEGRPCELVASFDDRLNATTGRLLVAQELERKRIAAELHDSLGQTLSLLNFELDSLQGGCPDQDPSDLFAQVERVAQYARQSLGELRSVIQGLRPLVLSDLGLYGALETLCADFRHSCQDVVLACEFDGKESAVPADIAVAVYRIAQEALNNTARHAQASRVCLRLVVKDDAVELLVTDDGVGFDDAAVASAGLGLESMGERTRILGGSFALESAPACGCKILARWGPKAVRQCDSRPLSMA